MIKLQQNPIIPILIITIALFITNSSAQLLKQNILINSDFSDPATAPIGRVFNKINFTVQGWRCKWICQINNCNQSHLVYSTNRLSGCTGFILDLNSQHFDETVTQLFFSNAGNYLLSFDYWPPYWNPIGKTIYVYFNSQLIYTFTTITSNRSMKYISQQVLTIQGSNNLTFSMVGSNGDGVGFAISNIKVQRIYSLSTESFINNTLMNDFVTTFSAFPSSRIIFSQFMNFFVNFDRLQLYLLHQRNYSYYSLSLLQNINDITNQKGTFFRYALQTVLNSTISQQKQLIESLDYKLNYTSQILKSKTDSGLGVMLNNMNLFVYSIPISLFIYLIFLLAFRLSFRWKFSRIFRKYFFTGILLLMISEGNIQQFIFYILSELLLFYSGNLKHKMVNLFIIGFLFSIIFVTLACFFWFRAYYCRKVRYLIEQSKSSLIGIVCSSIDRGLICLIFGVAHRILLNFPNAQLLVLGILQLIWITSRYIFLNRSVYHQKLLIFINTLSSMMRIIFQLTSFIYSHSSGAQIQIYQNQQIHLQMVYLFLLVWGLQLLLACILALHEIKQFLLFMCKNREAKHVTLSGLETVSVKQKTSFLNKLTTSEPLNVDKEKETKMIKNITNFKSKYTIKIQIKKRTMR